MIDILIFSKDRACQCDLLIKSMLDNLFIKCNLYLQYTYSDDDFKKGYDKLKEDYKFLITIKESNIKDTLINNLENFKNDYCMFLVDDNVFINKVTDNDFNGLFELYNKYNAHTLSFRMNKNIDYCFPAKQSIKPPDFIESDNKYIIWEWTKAENQHYCWGYPMAVDSHLYKNKEILEVIKKINFNNVNELESGMNHSRYGRSVIVSFAESKIYNIQDNFVKNGSNERVKELNDLYLNNKKIKTDNIYGIKNNSCHGILDYDIM